MLLVEDVFPYLGDLDVNDIILNFRIKYEIDASKPVAQTESPYVKAIEFSMQPVVYGGLFMMLREWRLISLAVRFPLL